MRVMGGVAAAGIVAVSVMCGLNCAFAEAQDEPETNDAEVDRLPLFGSDVEHRPLFDADGDRYLLFGGSDLWRSGGFLHGGVLASPGGLGNEGFTFKLLFGGGVYRYQTGGTEILGETALAAAMPGWRFKFGRLEITAVAGLDVQAHHLTPVDPGNRMRGTHAGLRAGADLWYQPSDAMMITAAVSASTIGPNYWSRVATGWRFLDWAWVGPEALALGGSTYQQVRLGVHATAFKIGSIEWSTGFGYVRDSDHHAGVYGRIGLLTRR